MAILKDGAALTWPGVAQPTEAERANTHSHDYVLAQSAARGDMQAFEEIYRRHYRRVYGLSLRMTQNVAEAEDVTQEVFVLLLRALGTFRGEANFTTWLHRLTVNKVLMRFRKIKARREDSADDADAAEAYEFGPAGNPKTVGLNDRIALDRALGKLPPGYRAAFVLHDIEGYEHEEIARILGCAVGTSKSQLHKARASLRKLLAPARTISK